MSSRVWHFLLWKCQTHASVALGAIFAQIAQDLPISCPSTRQLHARRLSSSLHSTIHQESDESPIASAPDLTHIWRRVRIRVHLAASRTFPDALLQVVVGEEERLQQLARQGAPPVRAQDLLERVAVRRVDGHVELRHRDEALDLLRELRVGDQKRGDAPLVQRTDSAPDAPRRSAPSP